MLQKYLMFIVLVDNIYLTWIQQMQDWWLEYQLQQQLDGRADVLHEGINLHRSLGTASFSVAQFVSCGDLLLSS